MWVFSQCVSQFGDALQQRRRNRPLADGDPYGWPVLKHAADDDRGQILVLPHMSAGSFSLVCPVSVCSCWVYAAHFSSSLGIAQLQGRGRARENDFFDRCLDPSFLSRVPAYARGHHWATAKQVHGKACTTSRLRARESSDLRAWLQRKRRAE